MGISRSRVAGLFICGTVYDVGRKAISSVDLMLEFGAWFGGASVFFDLVQNATRDDSLLKSPGVDLIF